MTRPKIAIIGLGRLGASMGLALKKAQVEATVVGHDKDTNVAQRAAKRGAVDKAEWNLINACEGAGLIILALPLSGIAPTLTAISKYLEPGQIITDTAPTKKPVLEAAKLLPASAQFIGGDPIITSARMRYDAVGVDASDAGLFEEALYCLTPADNATEGAIQTVSSFVALLGAKPFFLDAYEHDALVTGVRHLALALSAALMKTASASGSWRDLSRMAGADFYRATELLQGEASAHAETLLAHREALVHWINSTVGALEQIRAQIEQNDAQGLESMFQDLVRARSDWKEGQVGKETPTSYEDIRVNPMRLFLGGLADRKPRK